MKREKGEWSIYDFIDDAEAVGVREVWGGMLKINVTTGRIGNEGEAEERMNFNHLKRLREG